MDREELLDVLATLSQRHEDTEGRVGISQQEAVALLRAYDDGEITTSQLALAASRALRGALVDVTESVQRIGAPTEAAPTAMRQSPDRVVPVDARRRFNLTLLEDFDDRARQDAQAVARLGGMDAETWHERTLKRVRDNLIQNAEIGKGRPLSREELNELQDVMQDQAQALKKFADEVALRRQVAENAERIARERIQEAGEDLGEEAFEEAVQKLTNDLRSRRMSDKQIAARTQMYKGKSYEQFWRFKERGIKDSDLVVDYIALDDGATCGPCAEAQNRGPYLPGQGPFPGAVCLGGGHCRCRRDTRRDAALAAELRGDG